MKDYYANMDEDPSPGLEVPEVNRIFERLDHFVARYTSQYSTSSPKAQEAAIKACRDIKELILSFAPNVAHRDSTRIPLSNNSCQNRYVAILATAKKGFDEDRTWGQRFLDGFIGLLKWLGVAKLVVSWGMNINFFAPCSTQIETDFRQIVETKTNGHH